MGKNVMAIKDVTKPVDVSNLNPGMYFITDGTIIQKLIKN